jgi:hypothetical protein
MRISARQSRPAVARRMESVRRRFEVWREKRRPRSPIPIQLWRSAVVLAREYGVSKTSGILHLDYYALKKRVESGRDGSGPRTPKAEATSTTPSFVELIAPSPSMARDGGECIVELEDATGVKMRIHLQGKVLPDVAALAGVFLNRTER